jgi:hypothetical protein
MAKAPIDIRSLARSYTEMAIQTLAGVAKRGTSESARVAAASALLDRGWGKAVQVAEVTLTNVDPTRISDAELAAVVQIDGSEGTDQAPFDTSKLN